MRDAVRAFSLLELIAVMLIIAVTLAITAPSLRGFAAAQETHETASNMMVLLQHARMKAALEARTYRLTIDPTPEINAYWIEVQDSAEFKPATDSSGQRFPLPPGMIVQWISAGSGAAAQGHIPVNPNGTSKTTHVRLIGRTGASHDLVCGAPAEPFKVMPGPVMEVR